MNRRGIIVVVMLMLLLSACQETAFTADTMPWVGDEAVLFKDDFSDTMGGWTTRSDSLSFAGYDQSGFRLWADVVNYQFWSTPGLNFMDTLIYVRALKLDGPDDNMFGVICRYQNEENYYALVIGSDGYYGIFRTLGGEQVLIAQEHMDYSDVINTGDETNEIQAICQGDQLALFVNGVSLLQVQDDSLSHGDVGMIVGNFSESGVDILFDDFIVVKP